MKAIYKYSVTPSVEMPQGAQILDIQKQQGLITMWALVDPNAPMECRRFEVVGTGWSVGDGLHHIKTFQDEQFVWHVFELKQ
jgi:hypothetical protein